MASSDYVIQDVKGIKKSFDNGTRIMIQEYMKLPIFNMQGGSEFSEIFTSTESLSGIRELAEQEAPPTLALQDGYSVTLTDQRFGGAITVTQTDRVKRNDSSVKVRQFLTRQRDKLLKATRQHFITRVHLFLNEAFDNTSDYLAPDGVELCGTHTWSSGTTFTNKATAALSSSSIDTDFEVGGSFVDSAGDPWPQTWKTIVVKLGSAAERQAKKLFAEGISPTAINDINIYEGSMTIISTPYLTAASAAYYFLFDLSDMESPLYVGINQFPSLQAPIRQNNEDIRSNATGYWKQGINNMPMNVYGHDGTT